MFIDLGNHLAHVRVDGAAERPAIVMLHSLGTSGAVWDKQAAELGGDYFAVRPDFRGHGYSEPGADAVSIDLLADDVVAAVRALGLGRFTLAGISIGGLVAIKVAQRMAGAVSGLVLLDSCVASLSPPMWTDRAAQVRAQGLAALAEKFVRPWSSAAGRETLEARALLQILLRTPDEAYARGCDALATADCRAEAAQLRVPTLVAVGAEDVATPLPAAEELAAAIAGATPEVIDGPGHIPLFEQPAAVLDILRKALARAG